MCHDAPVIRPMPVGSPRRRPNNISRPDASGRAALVTDPSRSFDDFQKLPTLVRVPVSSSARREGDAGNRGCFIRVDHVDVHIAGECAGRLRSAIAALGGARKDGRSGHGG